jgi:hypothetical protein
MMEGFSERTDLSSSILELLAVMAITPMQAIGAPRNPFSSDRHHS